MSRKCDKPLATRDAVRHVPGMPPSRVDASRLTQLIETQELILRDEQARAIELQDQIEATRLKLDEYVSELDASAKNLSVYTQALSLYHRLLEGNQIESLESMTRPQPDPTQSAKAPNQALPKLKPARLGKQHYRMWHAIRSEGALSLPELASISRVSVRRAKLQMIEDVHNELIALNGNEYELTRSGADLLKRFEDYRRSNGQELPSLDVSQVDDNRDEAEPETQNEEEEAVWAEYASTPA